MCSETLGEVALSAWVSEEGYESIVVTNGNGGLVFAHVDTIDVGTISSRWEDSINAPSKLAVACSPVGSSGV